MEALGEMDIPIIAETGSEGGYSLAEGYFIPPIVFNRDEAFSLLLSEKLIHAVNIPGYSQYINSAFIKIKNSMNESQEKIAIELNGKIAFDIQCKKPPEKDFDFFNLTKKSLEENFKIEIQYFNPHKLEVTERVICPYGIIFEDGVWYLIAFCELRKEIRWFRIDRIKNAVLKAERFHVPGDFIIEEYKNESSYIKAAQSPNSHPVKLRLTKEMYYIVKGYYYFKYGEVIEEADCFIISVKTMCPEDYIKRAFQFQDGLEILEPLWLREEFVNHLKKLCQKYTI